MTMFQLKILTEVWLSKDCSPLFHNISIHFNPSHKVIVKSNMLRVMILELIFSHAEKNNMHMIRDDTQTRKYSKTRKYGIGFFHPEVCLS